jgi:hypothetical protein
MVRVFKDHEAVAVESMEGVLERMAVIASCPHKYLLSASLLLNSTF